MGLGRASKSVVSWVIWSGGPKVPMTASTMVVVSVKKWAATAVDPMAQPMGSLWAPRMVGQKVLALVPLRAVYLAQLKVDVLVSDSAVTVERTKVDREANTLVGVKAELSVRLTGWRMVAY